MLADPADEKLLKFVKDHKLVGKDRFDTAKRVHTWITKNVKYDAKAPPGKDALETLEKKRGNCSAQSWAFVALCRAGGVPARVVIGGQVTRVGGQLEPHGWAEFYGYGGWVPVEPQSLRFHGSVPTSCVRYGYFDDVGLSKDPLAAYVRGWQLVSAK